MSSTPPRTSPLSTARLNSAAHDGAIVLSQVGGQQLSFEASLPLSLRPSSLVLAGRMRSWPQATNTPDKQ